MGSPERPLFGDKWMQSVASRAEAIVAKRLEFSEELHPRDDHGKWTDGGAAKDTSSEIGGFLKMVSSAMRGSKGMGLHGFALKHGQEFKEVLAELPKGVRQGKLGECYMNAYQAADADPKLTYVEGFASAGVFPVPHAWVVDEQDRVIDPTWGGKNAEAVAGGDRKFSYWGTKFTTDYVTQTVLARGFYGVIENEQQGYPLLRGTVPPGAIKSLTYDEDLHPRDDHGRWSSGGGTDSEALKSWFGKSVVTNGDGSPKRMFHSSSHDFDEFRPGSHFGTAGAANDRAEALNDFSVNVVGRKAEESRVLPVYLAIENPLRMPDLASQYMTDRGEIIGEGEVDARLDEFSQYERPHPMAWESETDLSEWLYRNDVISSDEFWDVQYSPDKAMALLKSKGYDGIVYNNSVEDAGNDSYIIFDPNQVKSAIASKYSKSSSKINLSYDEDLHPRDDHGRWSSGGGTPTGKEFEAHVSAKVAEIAQKVYDQWDENEDEYAGGGICHLIAEDVANHLNDQGIEAQTVSSNFEQHVYVVAPLKDGVYVIDIHPSVYETGGGYSWKKIQGVKIDKSDVTVSRIDPDPKNVGQYAEMSSLGEYTEELHPRDDHGRWTGVGGAEREANLKEFVKGADKSVLNPDGSPRMFYHGTKDVFDEFKATRFKDQLLFFSTDPDFASGWATRDDPQRWPNPRNFGKDDEAKVQAESDAYYAQIDIKRNPETGEYDYFRTSDGSKMTEAEKQAWSDAKPESQYTLRKEADVQVYPVYLAPQKAFYPPDDYPKIESFLRTMQGGAWAKVIDEGKHKYGNWLVYEKPEVTEWLTKNGYDGLWLSESSIDPKHETLAVWNPKIVKSAIGNVGTYDKTSSKINLAFDPDQARDDHGRWTGGGGQGEIPRFDIQTSEHDAKLLSAYRSMQKAAAHATLLSMGMESQAIEFIEGAAVPIEALGGAEAGFSEGGHYDHDTGEITVNLSVVTLDYMDKFVRHEATHARYHEALRADSKNPAQPIHTFINSNMDQLVKDDGVTDYSKAWWKNAVDREGPLLGPGVKPNTMNAPWTLLAINETLAEIAAKVPVISDRPASYQELYQLVNDAWADHYSQQPKSLGVGLTYEEEQHPRDDHGRWADGAGKGGASELKALEKHLVDYKAERGLTGPESRTIAEVITGAESTTYLRVPGIDQLHNRMGVQPTLDTDPEFYTAQRDKVFESAPVRDVPFKDLVFTQSRVNLARVNALAHLPAQLDKPVQILKVGDKHYVMNGHHRAAAAFVAGRSGLRGNVLDLSGHGSLEFSEDLHPRDDHGRWTDGGGKHRSELTGKDMVPTKRSFPRKVLKDGFRGEMFGPGKHDYMGNVYLIDGKGYVLGIESGKVLTELPGNPFDPKAFEKSGGQHVSASQYVQWWRFKKPDGAKESNP